MAPRNMKKVMKSRTGELYGIRFREGSCKPTVELRLPRGEERIWRVMEDLETAKRFVKFSCQYMDGGKAFPPDHPDLPQLEAFCKNEFSAFIWEEFQRNDGTELLEDPAHGLDEGKTATNAPESDTVHFEVESFAGDVQPIDLGGGLRTPQNLMQLEHERKVAQERVQVAQEGLQVAQERVQVAQQWLELADLRYSREGLAPMPQHGGFCAPLDLEPFGAGPSHTRGSIASPECDYGRELLSDIEKYFADAS